MAEDIPTGAPALPEPVLPEPVLPEPVRDHLGQQLRSVFQVAQEQPPQYLGDPVTPDAFAPQLNRLKTRLKTHEEGTSAVEAALGGAFDDLVAPPSETGPRGVD